MDKCRGVARRGSSVLNRSPAGTCTRLPERGPREGRGCWEGRAGGWACTRCPAASPAHTAGRLPMLYPTHNSSVYMRCLQLLCVAAARQRWAAAAAAAAIGSSSSRSQQRAGRPAIPCIQMSCNACCPITCFSTWKVTATPPDATTTERRAVRRAAGARRAALRRAPAGAALAAEVQMTCARMSAVQLNSSTDPPR